MVLPSANNYITLSNVQAEFGGVAPISFSEYYAGGAYVSASVTGIPSSGYISFSSFAGKSAAPSGVLSSFGTWHTANASTYYADNITNSYNYTFDGSGTSVNFITDGGGDMYDIGNYITIEGVMAATNIVYGTRVDDGTKGYYVSPVNVWPFIALAYVKTSSTITWRSIGNIGSDGRGTVSNFSGSYTTTSSGRSGSYWANINYNAYDPTVGSIWFTVTNLAWGTSSVTSTTDGRKTSDADNYNHYMTAVGSNFFFGFVLLSRTSGQYIDATMVTNFLSNYVQNATMAIS